MHKQQRKNKEEKDGFQELKRKIRQARENTSEGGRTTSPAQ